MIKDVTRGDKKTSSHERMPFAQLNYQLIDLLAEWLLVLLLTMCKSEEDLAFITPAAQSAQYFNKTSKMEFSSEGGEKALSFATNKQWKVQSSVDWCKISPTEGESGQSITIAVATSPNDTYDERNASVRIAAGDSICTLVITQKQKDAILFSSNKCEIGVEGGTIEIEIKANINYTVNIAEEYQTWISEQKSAQSKSLNTSIQKFTIQPSTEYEKREGLILFKSGNLIETVKVYQTGSAILVLSSNKINVPSSSETVSIEVKSNFDFGVIMPNVNWIRSNITRSVSTHTLHYIIDENNKEEDREAEIIYYDKNSELKETVHISQAKKENKAHIIMNINDPHFLTINTIDDKSVYFYGKKNKEGLLESLNQIQIIDAENKELEYILDEKMRPTSIRVYNGVYFNLEWISDSEVSLTAFDPNSNIQVNTLIDINKDYNDVEPTTKAAITNNRRGEKLRMELRPKSHAQTKAEITQGGIQLEITQCDSPYSATNWINIYNNTTEKLLTRLIPVYQLSEGKYLYECPSSEFPTVSAADIVNKIGGVLGGICTINDAISMANGGPLLCPAISYALLATGIGAAAAPEFFIACEAVILGTELLCQLNPEGMLQEFSKLNFMNKEFNLTSLKLVPVVNALPNDVYGNSVVLKPGEISANLHVDLGGTPTIRTFTLNPSNPAQSQSYIATADLFCIPIGSIITVSIIGTDGYTDSVTTVSEVTTNFTANLRVPGAMTGVKDVCTVVIQLPNGKKVTRQAALVFGQ